MEIKKQNKFSTFFKRFGAYIVGGAIIVMVVVTATVVGVLSNRKTSPVITNNPLVFCSPIANATVIKDYNDKKLQHNQTLNKWETHYSVDLTGEDQRLSVCLMAKFWMYITNICSETLLKSNTVMVL